MDATEGRSRVLAATALAGLAHVAFDLVATRIPGAAPPYLLLDHAGEVFRDLLALDRRTILAVASMAAGAVNGMIAGLLGAATAGVQRRLLTLGLILSGLWLFSGGLMILVYMSPPAAVTAGSLAAGIPRSFAVAWVVDRVLPRPSPAPE